MTKQELLSLIFLNFVSRNLFNLKNRIKELNLPEDTLQKIEEKEWVSVLNYGEGEIHYQRESFPVNRISKERIKELEEKIK